MPSMLSEKPLTPEKEAYAEFMERALRSFYFHSRLDLRRGYQNPMDENVQRLKEILDTFDDQHYQGLCEIVHNEVRHAISGILFQIKPYEVRDASGLQLDFENGLNCDAHLEWLNLTDPTRVRPAWEFHPADHLDEWASIKSIEQTNWRRYIAPIIGEEAVEAWLATRVWKPGSELVFVAEQDKWEAGVGFASVTVDSESQTAEVTALHVLRLFRGRYLGRALLSAAAQAVREAGVTELWLWTLEENAYTVWFCEKLNGVKSGRREAAYAPGFFEVAYHWSNLEMLVEERRRYT